MKKKVVAIVAALTLAILTILAYSSSAADTVKVSLKEKNNSGVTGSVSYGNRVKGTAKGLDPNARYFSFVYGAGSGADKANPCILTGELIGPGVTTVGQWTVDEDGNGTLNANAPVPASKAGSLSIRKDVIGTRGLIGPTPVDSLVACGNVGPNQTTTLGQVQDQLPALPKLPSVPTVLPNAGVGN